MFSINCSTKPAVKLEFTTIIDAFFNIDEIHLQNEGLESLSGRLKEYGVNRTEESIELKRKPVDQTKDSIEKSALKPEIKKNSVEISSNKRSAKHMRKDIIMGSVLIAILIFAIYIIRLINEEETKTRTKETSQYYEDEPLSKIFQEGDKLWEEILFDNFDILSESLQALDSSAPFTFRIATAERLWYNSM